MSRTKNPKAKSGDVAKIARQWLRQLNGPSQKESTKASDEIVKIYTDERKADAVNTHYGKYLCKDGYFRYDTFTMEDCLDVVDRSIVKACSGKGAKALLKKMDRMTDSELGNEIMKLVNQRVNSDMEQYIANQNGCSRYQAQQLKLILESGLDLYESSAGEILEVLKSFKNGQKKKDARKKEDRSLHAVYTLRRTLSDKYSYLREIVEIKYPDANQAVLCKNVKKRFHNDQDPILAAAKIDDIDLEIFDGFFLATAYIAIDKYGKDNGISNMANRTKKIKKAIEQMIEEKECG